MTSLIAAQTGPDYSLNEESVRATTSALNPDVVQETAPSPEQGMVARDATNGAGLNTSMVSDQTFPRVKAPPVAQSPDYAAPINSQVSTSGTAAAREAAGVWGHGSYAFINATDPLNGEQSLGRDYFTATHKAAQGSTDNSMIPLDSKDMSGAAEAASDAADAARDAAYNGFLRWSTS